MMRMLFLSWILCPVNRGNLTGQRLAREFNERKTR